MTSARWRGKQDEVRRRLERRSGARAVLRPERHDGDIQAANRRIKNVGDLLRRTAAFYFLPVSLLCACALVGVVSPQSKAKAQAATVSNCDSEEAPAQIKIHECSKIIQKNPKNAAAYNSRGRGWYKKGIYNKAIADFSKAIELKPTYSTAYNNRGMVFSDIIHDYDRAIADFNEAINLTPDEAGAYYNRGLASERKNDFKAALTDFKRFVEMAPADPDGPKAVERVKLH